MEYTLISILGTALIVVVSLVVLRFRSTAPDSSIPSSVVTIKYEC